MEITMKDRDYTAWEVFPTPDERIKDKINPVEQKLFHGDMIQIDENDTIQILHSKIKTQKYIPGILMLENNKTFGRSENKKRLLYRCIPDDEHLPVFLIPYEIKLGFNKAIENKYCIFGFDHWNDKHPRGLLLETIGDVSVIEFYYEYQLYCKNIHHSLNEFTKKTRSINSDSCIDEIKQNKMFQIEDRRDERVFTIDPVGSLDFDDGFSVVKLPDERWKVSVYIANVYVWAETLGLWSIFSNRVSTIYLPDNKRPMLPPILSDNLCSLQQKQRRFVCVMDVVISSDGKIVDTVYKNAIIRVYKNYVYDEEKLLEDVFYRDLFEITKKIDTQVKDSHDVVSFWMIQMNILTGRLFESKKIGVFRTLESRESNTQNIPENMDEDTQRMVTQWNQNVSGNYEVYDSSKKRAHSLLNTDAYIHITSPIRRVVDIFNQIYMMIEITGKISVECDKFLQQGLYKMDSINRDMKSIRKIQVNCELLYKFYNNMISENDSYTSMIIDKQRKETGYSYTVYVKELKMISKTKSQREYQLYTDLACKLYLFQDEHKIKKKIRLEIV